MDQYLNKNVVATFQHEVGFPDGTLGHMVQGVVTAHNKDLNVITLAGIDICYRVNLVMSICLGAAEQYKQAQASKRRRGQKVDNPFSTDNTVILIENLGGAARVPDIAAYFKARGYSRNANVNLSAKMNILKRQGRIAAVALNNNPKKTFWVVPSKIEMVDGKPRMIKELSSWLNPSNAPYKIDYRPKP